MNDLFKSALSNISSTFAGTTSDADQHGGNTENAFVGQTVELEGQRLRVERVIAEGMLFDRTSLYVSKRVPCH